MALRGGRASEGFREIRAPLQAATHRVRIWTPERSTFVLDDGFTCVDLHIVRPLNIPDRLLRTLVLCMPKYLKEHVGYCRGTPSVLLGTISQPSYGVQACSKPAVQTTNPHPSENQTAPCQKPVRMSKSYVGFVGWPALCLETGRCRGVWQPQAVPGGCPVMKS
jgi:hypothetical protein